MIRHTAAVPATGSHGFDPVAGTVTMGADERDTKHESGPHQARMRIGGQCIQKNCRQVSQILERTVGLGGLNGTKGIIAMGMRH